MPGDRNRNILLGVAVVIVIVLVVLFIARRKEAMVSTSPVPTSVSSYQQELQNTFGITVPDTAIKADLKDVSGGSQMGLATLDKTSGASVYTVLANLEDPTTGLFYQAWLVADGNTFVSLGKLSLVKGGWLTNYTTTSDLSNYKTVWVTTEKVFDTTPETHILEGNF